MIEILRSFFIGAIQGISEFLPISSSGHLVLVPYLFNWDYKGLSFDVALHFGTAIAIVAYFWRDWINIIASAIMKRQETLLRSSSYAGQARDKGQVDKKVILSEAKDPVAKELFTDTANDKMENGKYPQNLFWQIVVASIPAAIVGFFLDDYVESNLHSPLLIACNLIVFGLTLWLVDKYSRTSYKLQVTSYKQTLLIGFAQAIALFPGVSRSGITMTAGRLNGMDRKESARFSFLLATPAMVGAFAFKLKDLPTSAIDAPFIVGVITSALFGFIAIKYLLKYLERGSFSVFVWYRILIAGIVLAFYFY